MASHMFPFPNMEISNLSIARSWLVNLKDRCSQLDDWFEEPRQIPKACSLQSVSILGLEGFASWMFTS